MVDSDHKQCSHLLARWMSINNPAMLPTLPHLDSRTRRAYLLQTMKEQTLKNVKRKSSNNWFRGPKESASVEAVCSV